VTSVLLNQRVLYAEKLTSPAIIVNNEPSRIISIVNIAIAILMALFARAGLGINAKIRENNRDPALSFGFAITGLDEKNDNIQIVLQETKRPFYIKGADTKEEPVQKEIDLILKDSPLERIDEPSSIWLSYDITSPNNVFELNIASCPLDLNRKYYIERYSNALAIYNLGVPINSISINDITVQYRNSDLRTLVSKNIRKHVRFNKTVNQNEDFFILMTEIFLDNRYLLCNTASSSLEGPPNYKEININMAVRSVFNEIFEYRALFSFDGISMDFELNLIQSPIKRFFRNAFGVRWNGKKHFD